MKIVKYNNYIINVEELVYAGYDVKAIYEHDERKEYYEITIVFKNSTSVRIKFDTIEEANELLTMIENKIMEK